MNKFLFPPPEGSRIPHPPPLQSPIIPMILTGLLATQRRYEAEEMASMLNDRNEYLEQLEKVGYLFLLSDFAIIKLVFLF